MGSSTPEDSIDEDRVLGALIDSVYRQSAASTPAAFVVIGLVGAFFWQQKPHELLVTWLAIQAVSVAVGGVAGLVYVRKNPGEPSEPRFWARASFVTGVLFGGAWGLGNVLLFDARDAVSVAFMIVFTAGMVAGSVIQVSCQPSSFFTSVTLMTAPLIAECFLAGGRLYTLAGVGMTAYLLFCMGASRTQYQMMRVSVLRRFQNEELARRLGEEKERAERAFAARSKVLAAASHDLRQPLHALGMFVELLAGRLERDEQRELLGRIRASAVALSGLLNALLDLSRLDSNTIQVRREHFALAALFEQLGAEYAEAARQKGLTVGVAPTELVAHSDPELVARLLRNLLSNAVRFTDSGEIGLGARQLDDGRLELFVADTGIGIAPAEQSKIFDEFYQVGNLGRDRERGLGLGLAIVRGLAKILGHELSVVSQPERARGTEMRLVVAAGDATAARAAATASSGPRTSSLAGRRVLVLDDERDIRDAMSALLESWDCTPVSAETVDAALRAWPSDTPPDLVLCDYRLAEGVTGVEALAALEARFGARLTSVLITGDTSPERMREAKSTGRPVLFKPVMPGKLRALLSSLLSPTEQP